MSRVIHYWPFGTECYAQAWAINFSSCSHITPLTFLSKEWQVCKYKYFKSIMFTEQRKCHTGLWLAQKLNEASHLLPRNCWTSSCVWKDNRGRPKLPGIRKHLIIRPATKLGMYTHVDPTRMLAKKKQRHVNNISYHFCLILSLQSMWFISSSFLSYCSVICKAAKFTNGKWIRGGRRKKRGMTGWYERTGSKRLARAGRNSPFLLLRHYFLFTFQCLMLWIRKPLLWRRFLQPIITLQGKTSHKENCWCLNGTHWTSWV